MTHFVKILLMSFWPAFDSSHVGGSADGNVVVGANDFLPPAAAAGVSKLDLSHAFGL